MRTLESLRNGTGEAEWQPCVEIPELTHLSGFGNRKALGQRLKKICLMQRGETGRASFLMPGATTRIHP